MIAISSMGAAEGNAGNIYLSPHRDDAAFSLGALIAQAPGGTLVNIFTRSEYTAVPVEFPVGMTRVDTVSALRAEEDRNFMEGHRLEERNLRLDEPSLRGSAVFVEAVRKGNGRQLVRLAEAELAMLGGPLGAVLDELLGQGPRPIYCPVGIGGHVDHLLTCQATVAWARAHGRLGLLRFYEDLPYAGKRRERIRGLRQLRALVPSRLRRSAWAAGSDKLKAIAQYPSQHRRAPDLQSFRPAVFWPFGPHEAVWRLLTP